MMESGEVHVEPANQAGEGTILSIYPLSFLIHALYFAFPAKLLFALYFVVKRK